MDWGISPYRLWTGCVGIALTRFATAGRRFRCNVAGLQIPVRAGDIGNLFGHYHGVRAMVPVLGKSRYFPYGAASVGTAFSIASIHAVGYRSRPESRRFVEVSRRFTYQHPQPTGSIHPRRIIRRRSAPGIDIPFKKCVPPSAMRRWRRQAPFGGTMTFKNCTKCGENKPADKDNFYFRDGRPISACKECTRAQQNKKYAADLEFRERAKSRSKTPEARRRINQRNKERYDNDPEYRERLLARQRTPEARGKVNQRSKERRANDPAWRDAQNAKRRDHWANDSEYREKTLSNNRERYRNEPEYRQKIIDHQRKPEVRQRANQREKERRANDHGWRDAENARLRARYHDDPVHRETLLSRQRSPEVREKTNRRNRQRRADDPEWREAQNAKQLDRYHNNPEFRAWADNYKLVRAYGITKTEHEQMELEQDGRCAICEQAGALYVDHDHDTGQVRQLLCPGCNAGLGQLEENEQVMLSAAEYLDQPGLEPGDIPTLPDDQLFARLEIPNWEAQSRDKKFRRRKNTNLKQTYDISIDQYEWLLAKGNGVCWICLRPEESKRNRKQRYPDALHVDHHHRTGMIRGLLCGKCNNGIGAFADDSERIRFAIEYLEFWNEKALPPQGEGLG